jgi:putative flippase GtrA
MKLARGDAATKRFARFAGAAAAALTATEIALTVCNGVLHLTSTPAALASWFAGAVVSYVFSRWAWERKGRPDVLRETLPFWAISASVIVLLTLANKLGYHSAAWLHLTGAKHILWVDFIWLLANAGTFLLRFAIFHWVLFRPGEGAPRLQPRHAKVPAQRNGHSERVRAPASRASAKGAHGRTVWPAAPGGGARYPARRSRSRHQVVSTTRMNRLP